MEENVINNQAENLPFSDELTHLLDFTTSTLAKELPTLTVDLEYFILSIFSQKQSLIYRRLDSCLVSSSIDAIYNSYYNFVSSKALTAIKSNRKIIMDNNLMEIFKKAQDEAKSMNSTEVTSEHVFLTILADTDESNKTRKVFNKVGITYGFLKNKMQTKSEPNSDITTVDNVDEIIKIMGKYLKPNSSATLAVSFNLNS